MPNMSMFNGPFYQATTLTATIEMIEYAPQYLGSLGIFEVKPTATRNIFVHRRGNSLVMIPTSPIGAPPRELDPETENLVPLKTTRLAKGFTMYASEVEGIRPIANETEFMSLQAEYVRRMARVQADRELTEEFHRLGAVQGVLLDADGTSVIYDFYEAFGITKPAPISIDLANTVTPIDLKLFFNNFLRGYIRSSGGAVTNATRIHALAGDDFYDRLVTHPGVEKYYANTVAMQQLRDAGNPFESFSWGGITWHNYRGTDNNTTIAIPADEARLFPIGAGAFAKAQAPAEFEPWINTMGREVYALNIPDRERNAYTRGEIYAYPLYMCQRPDLLRSLVLA